MPSCIPLSGVSLIVCPSCKKSKGKLPTKLPISESKFSVSLAQMFRFEYSVNVGSSLKAKLNSINPVDPDVLTGWLLKYFIAFALSAAEVILPVFGGELLEEFSFKIVSPEAWTKILSKVVVF